MNLRQAAEQALKYFEDAHGLEDEEVAIKEALRQALAQPEQEPVAWGVLDDDGQIDWTAEYPFSNEPGWSDSVPLYTALPKREWVGLTVNEARDFYEKYTDREELIYAMDKFLEEKNT